MLRLLFRPQTVKRFCYKKDEAMAKVSQKKKFFDKNQFGEGFSRLREA